MSTVRDVSPAIRMPAYSRVALAAWAAAVVLYCVGDTGTTIVSLQLGGIEDAAVATWFLETLGYAGLVANKLLVVAVCWLAWRYYPSVAGVGPDPFRLVIPGLMVLRGGWLVLNNVSVIASLV